MREDSLIAPLILASEINESDGLMKMPADTERLLIPAVHGVWWFQAGLYYYNNNNNNNTWTSHLHNFGVVAFKSG